MNWIKSLTEKLGTRNGLLLFLVGLIILWLGGYLLIDALSSNEWLRYLRQLYFSRFTLIIALLFIFSASIPHLKKIISDTQKTATDLAIFRILFFGFLSIGFLINPSAISAQVLPFLELPESAQVPLPFIGWYPKIVPINETIVQIAIVLFAVSIYTSLLGIKTRWSILIFTITLFYLFAIPNLYGKVNHSHHLMWIPAVLAFSPCADRFSFDAYFRKRSNRSIRHSTRAYTLPFLMIWALIGLIYFFPGFWKMWSNGLDWFLTDNVRNQMYYKWVSLGDWLPFFRIDHYPILYKSSGLYTVIFELFFIPLLLNKDTRKLAIFMGIGFHIGTWVFMNIFFVVLLLSYLSFVNWSKIPFLRDRATISPTIVPKNDSSFVKWIGIGLITSCIVFGFGKWNSWPFTVFPTFDSIIPEEKNHLVYIGVTDSEERLDLPIEALHDEYTSPRYAHLEYNLIQSQGENKLDTLLLNQFAAIYSREYKQLKAIEIYVEQQSIIPEKKLEAPRRFIYSKNFVIPLDSPSSLCKGEVDCAANILENRIH